jgi:hypothetical protein
MKLHTNNEQLIKGEFMEAKKNRMKNKNPGYIKVVYMWDAKQYDNEHMSVK